ncbi:MAG TPA: adenylate/guanylate cyclase domain-containing protein [Gaiellaceae bacterium]|nr:adenylate/guanylate cyclase domain-containing protein [Gaiellaceae bacterium]
MEMCSSCGAPIREGARFCDSCGAPQTAPAETHEQRKTVTVVFCDVTGSTALGERLDAESFRRVMARYFDEARRVIERHGGTVEKFIGDAVMAVFGVPVVHEDDAVRAVRAAAELRIAIDVLNAELVRDYDTTLELRIGINTGEVVTGSKERLATGDAVNVAARLQQAAAPGEIVIGQETCALVRDAVTVEELVPIELKGKKAPVVAYRLDAVTRDAPGMARHLDAPMVGRTHERDSLEDAFANAVRKRTCALFTLLGTAGVGKSRLAREFLAAVDARVVMGHCLSYGEGITYWPVVEVLKQVGGSGGQPALDALLGETGTPTTPEEIAWAMRKLLEGIAQERPLVVVFDDVHWAEPTFLDLIEHVADLSRDAPILLLCLARPELLDRRPGWGGGKLNATTIFLEPLDAGETEELIERLLGGEQLDPELVTRIRTAADGNPLFVEEMLAMVRASGEREIVVPPTIKALLAARLDQLDPIERNVLERGSVEGQLFHSAAVEAIAREPASVDRQLVALVRKELVRPERAQIPVGDAYRFRHILIRDAAYDALPKAVRAELHERFAAWLDDHGTDLVERDEIVAYHLEQAYRYRAELGPVDADAEALAARAAELLIAAGHSARLRGDMRAAASLLDRAASLPAPGRLALLVELCEVLAEGTGELERATVLLVETMDEARAVGDDLISAMAAALRSAVAGHVADPSASFERTIALAIEAAALAERKGDEGQLASMLFIAGQHHFFAGQSRAAEGILAEAMEHALLAQDLYQAQKCIQWTLGARAWGAASRTEIAQTREMIPEVMYTALEHAPFYHWNSAAIAMHAGQFDEARVHCARARTIAAERGMDLHGQSSGMVLGTIELMAGQPEAAERTLRSSFDRLGELGETGYRSTVAGLLAEALYELGRDDEAGEILDLVAEIAQADDVDPQLRLRTLRARLLARGGDHDGAERLSREAVELAATTDYLELNAFAHLALAEVLRASGAPGEIEALRAALDFFERKESVPQIERTRELLSAAGAAT